MLVSAFDFTYPNPCETVNWNAGLRYLVQGPSFISFKGRITDSSGNGVPSEKISIKLVDKAWGPDHGNNAELYERNSLPEILTTDEEGYFQGAITIPVAYGLYSVYTTKRHVYDHGELYFYSATHGQLPIAAAVRSCLFYIQGY